MGTKNKSYYRNWYQHWKEEEEEKIQASLNEVRVNQTYNVDQPQYKANHDLSRQYAGYSNNIKRKSHGSYGTNRKSPQTTDISFAGHNQFADILRGVLVGLPLVVVLLVLLYVGGIIPQDAVNQMLGINVTNPVTDYIGQYDELMVLHNNINQSISEHITANNVTSTYLQELKINQNEIITKTNVLLSNDDEEFSEMGRLLNLKLMSLDEMISHVSSNDGITDEVTEYYNQFVTDQNEVGNQIVTTLTKLLDENNIKYTRQVNGAIQIK